MLPETDDRRWSRKLHGYGTQFYVLGPVPNDVDAAKLDAELAKLKRVDPSTPVKVSGKSLTWRAYDFSWRYGKEGDLGHQGYHGLKRTVTDDFICLGRTTGGLNETLDDVTAKQWRKGYVGNGSLEARLREDTRILHDNAFWIHAMFIMGPQHTEETADRIVSFARGCEIETLQVGILTPLPGTSLFDEMRPHLIFDDFPGDWDYYDGVHCVYNTSRLGVAGLQKAVLNAHRRFYRWGWNPRALRSIAARPTSFVDKLLDLWSGVRTSKTMLRRWGREMETFVELAETKSQR